jgi:hypothetical protein
MTTANSVILGAGAGASVLALAGTLTWRLGIEFERAWLRALDAPPAQWERDLFARQLAEIGLGRQAEPPAAMNAAREPALV